MASPEHYRLTVLHWPKESLKLRFGIFDTKEPEVTGKRIDLIVGYSPDLENMKEFTRFELKTTVAGVPLSLDVFFVSYKPDDSGQPFGAMSWRPFLTAPEPQKSPVV